MLDQVNAITEVPLDHWDWRLYYDADPQARDKICSKWGGFLADMPFDPLLFGMPPNSLPSIEPLQLFAPRSGAPRPRRRRLRGSALRPRAHRRHPRRRRRRQPAGRLLRLPLVSAAAGHGARRAGSVAADHRAQAERLLPEWTEDSFPGILMNVGAGRVANRFNLGGPNYSIDAACGSSLAALYAGVRELEMGTSDVVVVMGGGHGAESVRLPGLQQDACLLSPKAAAGRSTQAADGIVISEGVGAVILKRLADAERDGDRIYAVIKGVGASSDGRDKGLTAPRPEGQLRALQRAYAKAGVSPARVELVEAHGTGTVAGDQTEVASLGRIVPRRRRRRRDPASSARSSR